MTRTAFPTRLWRIVLALIFGVALAPAVAAQERVDLATLLRESHVHGLAFDPANVDPANPDRLLIATHHGLFALDTALGATTLVGTSRDDFMGFSVNPGATARFFASGHPQGGGNLGVIASQDAGASWTAVSEGAGGPVDFHLMAVSGADPEVLYGIFAGMLQTSRDGGGSWAIVGPAPARLIDLATASRAADSLFAATEAGLLRSADRGATWTQAHPAAAPVSVVDIGTNGSALAFVLGVGLVQADETALDWTVVNDSFGDGYLLHLARHPDDPMQIYAVSGAAEMLVSQDGGASWNLVARP